MTGPLQVGLWYGSFSSLVGEVVFESFSIEKIDGRRAGKKGG
jgi:hypothetical protein